MYCYNIKTHIKKNAKKQDTKNQNWIKVDNYIIYIINNYLMKIAIIEELKSLYGIRHSRCSRKIKVMPFSKRYFEQKHANTFFFVF